MAVIVACYIHYGEVMACYGVCACLTENFAEFVRHAQTCVYGYRAATKVEFNRLLPNSHPSFALIANLVTTLLN
jgi:hypothetical protein